MVFTQILIPLIYSFILLITAFALGYFVLGLLKARRDDFLFNLSYSVLLGYGILSYLVLILSFLGPLNRLPIFIFLLAILVLGYKSLFYFYRSFKKVISSFLRQSSLNKVLIVSLVVLILFASISAFMPSFRGDVALYHLPEARAIVEDGILDFFRKGGNDWSALPLLMETLYALAIKIYGFTLTHLIHYQIFLAGVLAVYVFLRDKFNKTHGLLACILIFTLAEFIINATTAYVDIAVVSFNIAGLLVFIDWLFLNRKSSLILSALLFGFAASIKYSAFYSLLIVGLLILLKLIFIDKQNFRQIIRTTLLFFSFWIMPAGFWYLKNLIFYLNPLFPLFSIISIRWKIPYPRTLTGFLTLPFRVFIEPHYYPILLSFISLPLVFFIRKHNLIQRNKRLIIFLFSYLFAFFALWYFVGSQVKRYSMDGQFVLIVLAAIILGTILIEALKRIKLIWLIILAIFISVPLFLVAARYKDNYFFEIEKLQIEYLLGIKDKYDFYKFQNMGEGFLVSEYINENLQDEKIVSNLCPRQENFFLGQGNKFVSLADASLEEDWPQLLKHLKFNNINYLLVDWQEKQKDYKWRTGACTLDWQKYKIEILPLENLIKEHSELIFSIEKREIELYRINLK